MINKAEARYKVGSQGKLKIDPLNFDIRDKVESSFKENRRYQSLNKKSLNNIVFNPDTIVMFTKRKQAARGSDKSLVRKF